MKVIDEHIIEATALIMEQFFYVKIELKKLVEFSFGNAGVKIVARRNP